MKNYLNQTDKTVEDELHDECGVFGAYDFDGNDVASTIYYGLFALQHRGQESCGIAVSDTEGPKGKVLAHKDMGLVNEVFNAKNLENLKGNIGVGHVRYSTAGSSVRENAQPLVLNYVKGTLGLAHNGNLLNALELREELSYTGAIFQTTIDSEVIAYLIARQRLEVGTVEEAVKGAMQKLKGAYSLIVMSPRKLIGARDPFGFKPLCIGKRDNAYFLSSETCALDTVGAEFVRDVLPGEIVTITKDGIASDTSLCQEKKARCIFEYIYFARPDSDIDGMSVYESRINAGKILAKVHEGLKKELNPGMSTLDIDRIGEEMIRSFGCEPSFKNYQGYPASVCVSINEEVVHGIPRKDRIIEEGDIVSLDTGVIYKGYQSDAARTHGVGEITEDARLLIERTRQSFFEGMKYAVAGNHLHDISGAIGDYAESFGYGVVRDLCGHGIGTHMHEDPEIPNYRKFRRGIKLKAGMTLAVEPMINLGTERVVWMDDDWTVVTEDMDLSAHYENTILIREGKPEILSLTDSEIAEGIWSNDPIL